MATLQPAVCPGLDLFLTQCDEPRSRMSEPSSSAVDGFHRNMNRKATHGTVRRPLVHFHCWDGKCPFPNPAVKWAALHLQLSEFLKLPDAIEQMALPQLAATFPNIFMQLFTGKELHQPGGADSHKGSETWARRRRTGPRTTFVFLVHEIKISHRNRNWTNHLPYYKSRSFLRVVETSLQVIICKLQSFFWSKWNSSHFF